MTDKACGKRHRTSRPPKCNSKLCWAGYFKNNPGMVMVAARVVLEKGEAELEQVVGTKYLKFFNAFRKEANGPR